MRKLSKCYFSLIQFLVINVFDRAQATKQTIEIILPWSSEVGNPIVGNLDIESPFYWTFTGMSQIFGDVQIRVLNFGFTYMSELNELVSQVSWRLKFFRKL